MFGDFFYAAVLLFLIFDPFATIPVFLSMTKGIDYEDRIKSANRAVLVATILFVIFVVIGKSLLDLFDLSIASFRVAGGVMLFLLALEIIFNIQLGREDGGSVAWVVIASPLLTGPGAMTTAILLAETEGYLVTVLAGMPALFVTWILLRNATRIMRIIGNNVIDITSRIIGLLVAAMGVEFILRGLSEYFGILTALHLTFPV